jgi:hypothetical protein
VCTRISRCSGIEFALLRSDETGINCRNCKNNKFKSSLEITANVGKLLSNVWMFFQHIIPRN